MQDFVYHGLAVIFYLSVGVELAYITLVKKSALLFDLRVYQIDIAAVVRCSSSYFLSDCLQNLPDFTEMLYTALYSCPEHKDKNTVCPCVFAQ